MSDKLRRISEKAMSEGLKIDLTGCSYGETTGCCPFINRPTNYYHFLSGLVRSERLTYILEIGTHFGGSIMSMSRGLSFKNISKSRFLTVDITRKNDRGFREYPHIKRIQGDSLDEKVIKEAIEYFDRPIDILYIDSLHEYGHTKKNMEIYGGSLNPKYIILDDIRQCTSMQKLWREIIREFGESAFDASEISIRKGAGFGIIKWKGK